MASTGVEISAGDVRLSEPAFWRQSAEAIDEAFAVLRREAPVSFQPEVAYPPVIDGGPGYWALSKYADITAVTKDEARFCNGRGITIWDWPPELAEAFSHMLAQDDPEHTRLRRIVGRAFTPGAMRRMQTVIDREATRAVDAIAGRGEIEFVSELASRYPVRIICEMLGVPAKYHEMVAANTTEVVRVADPTLIAGAPDPARKLEQIVAAGTALAGLVTQLGEQRRANPGEDLISKLVNAEVAGEALDTVELTRFFILLAVGGADTTRSALSHGIIALTEHPEQKRRWLSDLDRYSETAPDEIIRWATPLIHFRRTATVDVRIGDAQVKAGDKVVLFYRSGNRDEDVFDAPNRFDIGRPTSPSHLSFGGRGIHHCLGQHLARAQIRAIFRELLERLPDIEVVGEPVYTGGSQVHGVEEVHCRFTQA